MLTLTETDFISIHAPVKGATMAANTQMNGSLGFQSTLP